MITRSDDEFFLRSRKRKRWRDAAALVPVLGVILLVSPIVSAFAGPSMSEGIPGSVLYIFSVWIGLILLAAWLSRKLGSKGA